MSNHNLNGKRGYNKKKRILAKQNGKCAKCQCIVGIVSDCVAMGLIYDRRRMMCFSPDYKRWIKVATFEHVTPKSKGGKDTDDNIIILCSPCNRKGGHQIQASIKAQLASMKGIPPHINGMK